MGEDMKIALCPQVDDEVILFESPAVPSVHDVVTIWEGEAYRKFRIIGARYVVIDSSELEICIDCVEVP